MSKLVHVAVGVICREQQTFLTRRLEGTHMAGKWEFPGGKVEADETVAEALSRELKEEVGIEVLACSPLINIEHDYGVKKVLLEVFLVDQFLGEPEAQEGQEQQWLDVSDLSAVDFPEANLEIVNKVKQYFFGEAV